MMQNVNTLDRIVRAVLGIALVELAYFWLAGAWQIVAYLAGTVLVVTAAIRFCPLYRVLGIDTGHGAATRPGKAVLAAAWLLLIAVAVGGSYASGFFTRKLFIEDFNAMNNYYKQTLFLTGKNEREKAVANYESLLSAYKKFQDKYFVYRPHALKGDGQLTADLVRVAGMLGGGCPCSHRRPAAGASGPRTRASGVSGHVQAQRVLAAGGRPGGLPRRDGTHARCGQCQGSGQTRGALSASQRKAEGCRGGRERRRDPGHPEEPRRPGRSGEGPAHRAVAGEGRSAEEQLREGLSEAGLSRSLVRMWRGSVG
ncbi:MAG: DUF2892 domain-containing protein [Betaproteobacteria bacterium]|nr:DUF2892 domain-containing protein [Betaproteobacteria bacterium]